MRIKENQRSAGLSCVERTLSPCPLALLASSGICSFSFSFSLSTISGKVWQAVASCYFHAKIIRLCCPRSRMDNWPSLINNAVIFRSCTNSLAINEHFPSVGEESESIDIHSHESHWLRLLPPLLSRLFSSYCDQAKEMTSND